MDEILLENVERLKKNLVDSDVYQNYLLAKKKLSGRDRELLSEYKRLHSKFVSGEQDNFEAEKIISSVYSKLMLCENTRVFLQNELLLTKCIKDVCEKITDSLEIDVFA